MLPIVLWYTFCMEGVVSNHRMPLYFILVSDSLRLARTLLKRLLSKKLKFNTQLTHASRHPGA